MMSDNSFWAENSQKQSVKLIKLANFGEPPHAQGMETQNTPSLYARLGGKAAVDAVVDVLYNRLLRDPLLMPFFADFDALQQRRKMKAFLAYAFGAMPTYTGDGLRAAHAHLVAKGLDDAHFDAVAEHLENILLELNVDKLLVDEVLAIVAATRPHVLGR
jgi:hemoglobin